MTLDSLHFTPDAVAAHAVDRVPSLVLAQLVACTFLCLGGELRFPIAGFDTRRFTQLGDTPLEQNSKSGSSQVEQLAHVLMSAGHGHHEAFIETDGFDPDWAIWYANYSVEEVNVLLGTELSRAELVYELIGLSREQPIKAPDASWPEYYAASLVDRLS